MSVKDVKKIYILFSDDICFHKVYGIYTKINEIVEDYKSLINCELYDKNTIHICELKVNNFEDNIINEFLNKESNFNKI